MRTLHALLVCLATLLAAPAVANCINIIAGNHEKTPDVGLVDNANQTITHTATGLIWKQCPQGLSGAGCATGTATTYTWQGALQQGAAENFVAQTDWRLPSRNELLSLVESACASNMINVTRFPNAPASATFWTSTPAGAGNPTAALAVNFGNGNLVTAEKASTAYVRLVRSGTADETFNQRNFLPATGPSNAFPLFTAASGVGVGTLATSNSVVLAGITGTVPVSIDGGISGNDYQYQVGAAVTLANATDIITWTAHPLRIGDIVTFTATTLPTGITAGTPYYVIAGSFAANTFQVSATPGGTALNFTTDGTGVTAWLDWQGNTYTRSATVTFTNATDLVNLTEHRLAAGASVIFTGGTAMPTGITAGTRYYVIASGMTANAFQISTEPGGTPLNFTTDGTGTITGNINWANATRNIGMWTIVVRATAASTGGTTQTATLTINNRATSYAVTTLEPTPVVIPAKTGVALNTVTESAPVSVTGLTALRAISIASGTAPQYRISSNGGSTWSAWTNVAGNIANNNLVQVRQTSAVGASTLTTTNLTINSQVSAFNVTTGLAVEPADMAFTAQTNAELNSFVISDSALLSGLTATLRAVTFTNTPVGAAGQYSLSSDNGVTWSAWSATGNVNNADNGKLIRLRLTSAAAATTLHTATLTINARTFPFAVTTGTALDYPDPIAFDEQYNVTAGTGTATSNTVTISGLSSGTATIALSTAAAPFAYRIGAGGFVTTGGTVLNNNTVTVQITPMRNCHFSPVSVNLLINGYAFPFTAWTGAGPAGPTIGAFTNATGQALGATVISNSSLVAAGGISCIAIRGEGNPQYSINGTAFTNATQFVSIVTNVRVQLTAASSSQTTRQLWLMINGTEYPFSVTTN